jgi:amidase
MARSAADLVLELSVLAGPDEMLDGIGYKLALPEPRHDNLADFRILVLDSHPLCPTAASIEGALEQLIGRLAKLGCKIVRASPQMPDLAQTTRNYDELLSAALSVDYAADDRARIEAAATALSPDDQSLGAASLRGATMSHAAWARTSRIRNGLRSRWQALFQEIDVIVCPPMPTTAFPHDHSSRLTRQLDVDGKKVRYFDQIVWAAVATANGLPATVIPIAQDDNGLPTGAQIIGGYLEDRTTIAFAALMEREFGGFKPPPNL